LQHQ